MYLGTWVYSSEEVTLDQRWDFNVWEMRSRDLGKTAEEVGRKAGACGMLKPSKRCFLLFF